MTGRRDRYTHLPMFWGNVGDLRFRGVGRIDSSLRTVGVFDDAAATLDAPTKDLRGVVYYLDDGRIVGVLLCNVGGNLESARKIVKRGKPYYDMNILKSLIDIRA